MLSILPTPTNPAANSGSSDAESLKDNRDNTARFWQLVDELCQQHSLSSTTASTDLASDLSSNVPADFPADFSEQLQSFNIPFTRKGNHIELTCSPIDWASIVRVRDLPDSELNIYHFRSIDSTNNWLKDQANTLDPDKTTICTADHQSAGRGRNTGKKWYSPFGASLYYSIARFYSMPLAELVQIGMATGVVCCQTLEQLGLTGTQLKWPNDIYIDGKKVGGILSESLQQDSGLVQLIVGIGINISMPQDATSIIDQDFTDLQSHTNINKSDFVALLTANLNHMLTSWHANSWDTYLHQWRQHDYLHGKNLELIDNKNNKNETIAAIAEGIDAAGRLLCRLPDGSIKTVLSGEVSVKARN